MMKLIDEKGRLFGLINLIDFFVVIFLLAMIPSLFLGYKLLFPKKVAPLGSDIKEIELRCQFINLNPDVAKMISVGDKEVNDNGLVIGEIVWLGEGMPSAQGQALEERPTKLRLKAQFKDINLYYKDRALDYNAKIVFNTKEYNATAMVREDITKIISINVTLKDLDEGAIGLIRVGDKELNDNGELIAEIVKIGKPSDSSFEFDLNRGKFTIGKIIEKKQVTTEMLLRCQVIQNEIYFRGKHLTFDLPIEFVTDKYRVVGFVSKTYEIIDLEKIDNGS